MKFSFFPIYLLIKTYQFNSFYCKIFTPATRVQCGRKGFDSGKEGEAEFSEWPWHVS